MPDTTGIYTLEGIPLIGLDTVGNTPTAARLNLGFLELQWAVMPVVPFTLLYPSNDPSWRGPFGGYAAGKKLVEPLPPPTGDDNTCTGGVADMTAAVLTLTTTAGNNFLSGVPPVENVTNAEFALLAEIAANVLRVTFTSAVNPGDQISWPDLTGYIINEQTGTLAAQAIFIP